MAWFIGRNGILFAGLCLLPLAFGDFWAYQLGLYFLYAIAALGVGICWGRAGFLPLGQAMSSKSAASQLPEDSEPLRYFQVEPRFSKTSV